MPYADIRFAVRPLKTYCLEKRPRANPLRHKTAGKYFAWLRARGKLIRRGPKTASLGVAKLQLSDEETIIQPA
jgi:hypothetical protein